MKDIIKKIERKLSDRKTISNESGFLSLLHKEFKKDESIIFNPAVSDQLGLEDLGEMSNEDILTFVKNFFKKKADVNKLIDSKDSEKLLDYIDANFTSDIVLNVDTPCYLKEQLLSSKDLKTVCDFMSDDEIISNELSGAYQVSNLVNPKKFYGWNVADKLPLYKSSVKDIVNHSDLTNINKKINKLPGKVVSTRYIINSLSDKYCSLTVLIYIKDDNGNIITTALWETPKTNSAYKTPVKTSIKISPDWFNIDMWKHAKDNILEGNRFYYDNGAATEDNVDLYLFNKYLLNLPTTSKVVNELSKQFDLDLIEEWDIPNVPDNIYIRYYINLLLQEYYNSDSYLWGNSEIDDYEEFLDSLLYAISKKIYNEENR